MDESQTVLITGATSGLGRALAYRLASRGTKLLLHGRSPEKLENVASDIHTTYSVIPPQIFVADLANLNQVRQMASDIRISVPRLDVLVSNAGIGVGQPDGHERGISSDGFELRFAVNYLAGVLLTCELLPLLRMSTRARIVNVASVSQHPIDFDDLMLERAYSGSRAYGQSKLAQIMFGFELASRIPATEVTVNSFHPASDMPTKMVLEEVGYSVDTIEAGVDSTDHLVSDPELSGITGRFFDHTREARAHPQAYDAQARAALWSLSLGLVDASEEQAGL